MRTGFDSLGRVRLMGATIGGQFACEGATFRYRTVDGSGMALNRQGAKIGESAMFRTGFSAEAAFICPASRSAGQLACDGATIRNRTADGGGWALNLQGDKIGESARLEPPPREGCVHRPAPGSLGGAVGGSADGKLGAEFAGRDTGCSARRRCRCAVPSTHDRQSGLACDRATFRNRTIDGNGCALGLDGAKIEGDVRFVDALSADGLVTLIGTQSKATFCASAAPSTI